ncbi:hypothetical protein [Sphaerisporangium dianthi]|uniref:Uncharacterized protein n=1 Tax=Sphaerisporangium dianthi TaxID=1436120 RepID=A0ABV9CEP9_9ACTN
MKSRTRIAAGALAAAAILAPTAVQAAAAPSPYAQAAAAVRAIGTLAYGKNIVSVSRPFTGRYCVRVGNDVDLSTEVVLVTPWNDLNKTYGVWTAPHPLCGNLLHTIMVAFNTSDTKVAANTPFFLAIP